jgi:hypothetical protein
MDGKTFDALTKGLGSGLARRRLLTGLVGGAFSGLFGRSDMAAKRKHSRRKKRRGRDDNAKRRTISAEAVPDCAAICPLVEGIAGAGAGSFCRQNCGSSRQLVVLLERLVEQRLIAASQLLQLLQRLFEQGIIGSANEFRRLATKFMRDGSVALCEGNLLRLCISSSGEIACCDSGQPCTHGVCQCPGGQVRCGSACLERCLSGEVRDPTRNCQCVCHSGFRRCGGRCLRCPRGQVLDQERCQCQCRTGGELCNEECYDPCPRGLTRDPETCECACPAVSKQTCCFSDDECGDSTVCIADRCDLATHRCAPQPIPGCCRDDAECGTSNPCTVDRCDAATNTCTHDRIDGCCRTADDCGRCEACDLDNTCVPDRTKDGVSCSVDSNQGACCNGDCATCGEGETLDLETCHCAGEGACICTREALGEPCEDHTDCCSGLCVGAEEAGQGRCTDPREYFEYPYCVPEGAFCLNENDIPGLNQCCSGVCTDCACVGGAPVCRELGDPDCASGCCGSAVCVSSGCCLDRGDLCTANSECCSGSCEDFYGDGNRYCACSAVGTPCKIGSCCSQICGPDGVCACSQPEDSNLDCRDDSDCCGGRCLHGLQAPDDGVDGLCCRFAGKFCRFGFECCSGFCDAAASACN